MFMTAARYDFPMQCTALAFSAKTGEAGDCGKAHGDRNYRLSYEILDYSSATRFEMILKVIGMALVCLVLEFVCMRFSHSNSCRL